MSIVGSWILVILIIAGIIGYILHRSKRVRWLPHKHGLRMPRWFEPSGESLVDGLERQTAREKEKSDKLRKVLEAKRELAKAKAENIRLRKEIDGVSEKSVEKEKREAEQEERDAQKAKQAVVR